MQRRVETPFLVERQRLSGLLTLHNSNTDVTVNLAPRSICGTARGKPHLTTEFILDLLSNPFECESVQGTSFTHPIRDGCLVDVPATHPHFYVDILTGEGKCRHYFGAKDP